ncbi:MAG: MBL fold metallo-hydrolase [Prevotella sp.]|jgi:phosphoribosyl 1,2-cyclic phosphate phosphodiesterase|nr:MBL fold metallo-hydrolase [Prevotella sp.]MBP3787397.1 MBL fold metallo-hydrolase [Prevotella sp.]MBQ2673346.1 MBL fold metallo-hydrolase [Prevotella sp.]MBR1411562.1 MBL fold metallo-hydrolase [Prevotella sp.]
MKLTFLGTGTSCGVPTIGCHCYTCSSKDPHDKRLRCSVLIETETTRLLIDCGPDFRQQIMDQPFRKIDGILITHAHYDHMGGMDDIRPYCQFGEINVYADPLARQGMLEMLPYCFAEHRYPGVPAIQLHEIHKHEAFRIGDLDVMPFEVMHHDLPIMGYRIGSLAYITDMKTIDAAEIPYIEGCSTLVVNALREKPHHSHQTLTEAVRFAQRINARQTWLIHSSHDIGRHAEVNASLPQNIQLAYDGQVVEV